MVDAAVYKNCQMRYLSYCFTDFDKIWYNDYANVNFRSVNAMSFYFLPQNNAKSANKRLHAKCV